MIAILHCPEHRDLLLDRDRVVLGLLEELDDALAAIKPRLGRGIEIGAKLRESRQLAELGEVELNFAGDLFDRLDLRGGTDAADRKTDRDGGTNALKEQIGLEINLAIGDGDDVGRNVGRHVAGLSLDDGQRRQRTAAVFFGHAGAAFEQTRVQIKNVARISFTTGRPLQNERNLAISHGVLGKIVINDERIHAIIHEPLAHGGAGKRREILVRRAVRGGRRNDRRVGHRPVFLQDRERARDVRVFLADRDVNAIERPVILRCPSSAALLRRAWLMIVSMRDRGFAGRAVADDQLALATTDRDHGVDRHDAGLDRLANAPSLDNAGRDFFDRIKSLCFDRPLAIERLPESVYDATKQALCRPGPGEACRSSSLHRLPKLSSDRRAEWRRLPFPRD